MRSHLTEAAVPDHEPAIGFVQPRHGHALNLLAGQLYFGTQAGTVKTLLGSCVALVLWHPQRRIGAMCHYLLPCRQRGGGMPDARFGDEAIGLLLQAIGRSSTRPADFQTHLYGGADTMPGRDGPNFNIGERNIAIGCELIDRHGFDLQAVDVGDFVPRTVVLDLHEGRIAVRRGSSLRQTIQRMLPR
ncbi:chemotaxis protein [Sphaerotilus natans subsp. natans DSM 6575]|uniref:Probable chemoreceptor glutamine deamidase CheD n=1 Tax=Sphaerotilus natans subsp. natans DSM 6575 TaxID=1286631 RepID=A0A059KKL9_9BURK|nr:chemotaxis protein CheD [Sphaerotilus natans]KDB51769.1 chemotaxis protein [Sphaerotilus natans subsp. natans DSM 6575]SIQ49284.1 chemotaxis protein CheD [Sphaerotilus natans]